MAHFAFVSFTCDVEEQGVCRFGSTLDYSVVLRLFPMGGRVLNHKLQFDSTYLHPYQSWCNFIFHLLQYPNPLVYSLLAARVSVSQLRSHPPPRQTQVARFEDTIV